MGSSYVVAEAQTTTVVGLEVFRSGCGFLCILQLVAWSMKSVVQKSGMPV